MATSDDPPFLTVGTEVSAKYRGAFCEATIKVAKKLVKCKVSYSKGNTALVSNEVVKGTLKVGTPVEVRQPDGQFLTATIMKLTDQSTYTVVFDDGDERTLKRSSLCLKGGRHFDKSESLDNLPLTDPENFGTPVLHSTKKPSRKRRRCSQSPSRKEDGVNGKRPCSYPDEFPVGKAVFLENDRRRSCWLPAVIVPAHYVMEESDRTPDTICLRSFKDGRFFASTKDELHDFALDKEPLLSMLEGDVQPMYMCKPAIERAMAYLDTGELPWDMDLFDKSIERHSATPTDEEEGEEDSPAEVEEFHEKLRKFHESKGNQAHRRPTLGQRDLNLYKLYKLVKENGGMEKVTQELKWRSLYLQMGMSSTSNASYAIKQAYKKYLYAFEVHEKGKLKQAVKESPGGWPNKRKRNAEERSSEERDKTVTEKPPAAKVMKPTVKEEEPEEVDMADVMSQNNDTKSETSDQDSSSQAENSSSNGDECPSHFSTYPNSTKLVDEDSVSSLSTYKAGDRIKVYYGKGKNLCLYEAKIIELEEGEAGRDYLVHYNGWNNRYDEWINETRICEKVTGPSKAIRPQYAKKKANKKKFAQTRASSDGPTISSAPSSTAVTPQQQLQAKKKIAEGKDVTPTLVLDKLMTIPGDKTPQTVSSCPVTPAASGKMVNGGHLPTQPQSAGGGGKGGGSGGKGNARATKRRKLSQSNETLTHPPPPPPPSSLSSVPPPPPSSLLTPPSITSSATTVSTAASSRISPSPPSLPVFNTPPPPPSLSRDQRATHGTAESIKAEGGAPVNLAALSTPSVVTSAPSPLPQTTACQVQALLDLNKCVVLPKSNSTTNVDSNGKVALPTGLNGAVVCGSASKNSPNKTDHLQGQNQVKVKKEEESFGWNAATALNSTNKNSRNFPNVTSKAEALGAEVLGSLFQAHFLRDTASSLICSERVPGIISGDLKPVIQPVRQIVRQSPNSSPRNRPSPVKKNNTSTGTVANPPDPSPSSSSSVFQNPPDSPPSSQSAAESSPSPPSSPNLPSSLKKLSHSSSSSSLASSLSTPAPSTSLLGINGVMRLEESTIQERDIPEEARMDMDDSNLPDQNSPASTLSDNSSEKERLSTGEQNVRSKGSQSPDGKRKWRGCETEEEMREKRRARRAALNFMVDFTKLPEMSSTEKVTLIQERMKNIQKKWVELKAEMSKIDRKRRKARKREREAARLAASQAQEAIRRSSSPSSTAAPTSSSVATGQQIPPVLLECH